MLFRVWMIKTIQVLINLYFKDREVHCPKFGGRTPHLQCVVSTYNMRWCNIIKIIRGKIASNHVHIYVSVPPYQSISKLVQYLKEKSSRKIQQEFPELRRKYWKKHLWAVGYFVRTTGNVTEQTIKNYIDKHESKEEKYGDFQVEN